MSRRAAQFHLTLGEIVRSTDTSPGTFLRYKNALLTHMTDFMDELDRYLPRLAAAVAEAEAAAGDERPDAMLRPRRRGRRAPVPRPRRTARRLAPPLDRAARLVRRRHPAPAESRAEGLRTATRAAVSGVIALLRQVTEAQRGGVNRSSQLRHLAEWVFNAPDEGAAYALMSAAFNIRSARHLGGAHDDAEQISEPRDLVGRARRGDLGHPVPPRARRRRRAFRSPPAPTWRSGPSCAAARPGSAGRARGRRERLLQSGAHVRVLDEAETKVLLRLLTLATEARTVVAGRISAAAGGNDVLTMRLVPNETGSAVQTTQRRPAPAGRSSSSSSPPGPDGGTRMASRPAAAARPCALSDLGSYQHAVRLVLTHDVITATRPRPGTLEQVLRWADQMTADFRELLGYTLIATTRQVRLSRRLDALDPTQSAIFSSRYGRPFDRRRLAYLCLVLASFQRSRVEISLADLVRAFTPAANAIDGLGFDPTVTAHKAAVVDVLDWLVDRGALRLSDGSAGVLGQRHRTRRRALRHRPRHLRDAVPPGPPGAAPDQRRRPARRHVRQRQAGRAAGGRGPARRPRASRVPGRLLRPGRAGDRRSAPAAAASPRTWPASPAWPSSAAPRASCWPTPAAASPTRPSPAAAAPSTARPACCWPRSPT